MAGGGDSVSQRTVVYCIVPRELAAKLHEPLRKHFRDDPNVEVIVEQRGLDRRSAGDRRVPASAPTVQLQRRKIHSEAGRRIGERRHPLTPIVPLELPRKARSFADRLLFVKRCEPRAEHAEDLDTARLVARFQAGDEDAFAALYSRYFDRVYAYLRMALDDEHGAEDATQQVFTQVFEGLPRYQQRGKPFRAWLFVVVRNHAISQLQKSRRLEVVDPQELDRRRERRGASGGVDLGALSWISDQELMLFIERLPLPQRQVLILRYLVDLKTSEIAEVLGRSETDIRTLDYRARGFLRKRLTSVGRDSSSGEIIRMRRWGKPASVLRSRRFALLDG